MKREPHLFHTSRAEYKWSISKCVCVVHICMYVLVCMSTPGHTYTGTCMSVLCMYMVVCVCVHRSIRTQAHVCVCPCDPLETKFTRSYHFP